MSEERQATELDFRMPEFRALHVKVEDYIVRKDGKVVRKDRFEQGIRRLACAGIPGVSSRDFEIDDIAERVDQLIGKNHDLQYNDEGVKEFYMHVKTERNYQRLFPGKPAKLQTANELSMLDMSPLVLYQAVGTGEIWARPATEFFDGRFVRINPPLGELERV